MTFICFSVNLHLFRYLWYNPVHDIVIHSNSKPIDGGDTTVPTRRSHRSDAMSLKTIRNIIPTTTVASITDVIRSSPLHMLNRNVSHDSFHHKVKAGNSLVRCEPAPSSSLPGCWTTLDASRFNVRTGVCL